jgi:endonuclease/exonuclease/phosphatase family metal-dependent hydrolase
MSAVASEVVIPSVSSLSLTVLTLNIHMGRSMFKRRVVLEELREAIRAVGADLVFLQEAVGTHPDVSLAAQYEFLGDRVWGDHAYGRNSIHTEGDHGNAILSKYPLLSWTNHDVSVEPFEARGLLHSLIMVPDSPQPLHTICVHLGLDPVERRQQLQQLCNIVNQEIPADSSVIVAGDFNDWRQQAHGVLQRAALREAFFSLHGKAARSFPARLPLLRLDRIYLRGLLPVHARVLSARPWSHLSDHAGLVATVRR